MRVLFVNSVCGFGSTGRIVERLAREVASSGGEALVCYGRKDYSGNVNAVKITTKTENYINGLSARLFDNEGLGVKAPTKRLIKIIEEFKPDIIHLHNLHGYYLNIKTLFTYLAKTDIKIVWTLHDCWAFTGHCAHFDYVKCEKYKTGCEKCPNKKEYPSSKLLDNSKRNYRVKKELVQCIKKENIVYVAPSKWLKGKIDNSFLKDFDSRVLYNGIDLTNFSLDKAKTNEQSKTVLAVASVWTEKKGYKDVVELAKRVSGEYKVVMVGVSDKQVEELKETDVVAVKRTSSQKELATLYQNAMVLVNPTYEEVFGMVNVEALASGTPVITYNTGGSVEVIDNNGYIVKQGNVADLINKIRLLEKQKFDRKAISDKAKQFSDENMAKNYMNLYEVFGGESV